MARVFWCLCNAGWCDHVSDLLVRHIAPLAIMPSAYQVPTICSHSRCWVEMGSPDPAVSTGLLHQLPFALPKLVSATAAALFLIRCLHVWTALRWQGFLDASATLVGAAMCPACFVRHIGPLAIMPSAYQVPTRSSHSRCWVDMGSPDPAVSTGLLHQLPSALPNFVSATAVAPCFYNVADTAAGMACGSR